MQRLTAMRSRLAAALFALAAGVGCSGCGEAVNKPSPAGGSGGVAASPLGAVAETPVQIVPMVRSRAVGALERPHAMRRFFEALARLEAGRDVEAVRIVQFGDSHTAADIQTATVRRALQARFGDGGRGFVAIGKPWRTYLQEGVRTGMSSEWVPELGRSRRGEPPSDGLHGLAGAALITSKRGARAWADVSAKSARAEIAYLEQPGGGSFDLYVDGARVARIATGADRPTSAFRAFAIEESTRHPIEVRAAGDGDVRVFGLSLSRARPGVILDALGINGARFTTPLAWNEEHWAEQLRHHAPALIVFAYGTNESGDDTSQQIYERQIVDALGRVARAVPSASCLLLGPPDRAISTREGWQTSPRIVEIVSAQRRVAEAAGCAFYDQLAAMGGPGSIAAWAIEDPPRGGEDRVHLTRDGYAALGSSFASDLLRAYATWQRETGRSVRAGAAARLPGGEARDE
jgi:lysophospholipase L1-like esterase